MKKHVGIWIDGTKAIIVTLENSNAVVTQIESYIENRIKNEDERDVDEVPCDHDSPDEQAFEERKQHQVIDYLDNVCSEVEETDDIFIFGPAEMKTELGKKIMCEKNPNKSVKAMCTTEKMTDRQIIAKVKEFYQDC